MPIYVAKEYGDKTIGMVLAKSEELAQAYWQGRGIYPHHVDVFSEASLDGHPTGVLPLLIVRKKEVYEGTKFRTYLVID